MNTRSSNLLAALGRLGGPALLAASGALACTHDYGVSGGGNGDESEAGSSDSAGDSATQGDTDTSDDENGDGDGDGDGDGEDDGNMPKLDVGADDGGETCDGYGEQHSYIWIANSGEGTVSKLDTQTMVEEGRYLVRDDGLGSPSRTSVALTGDMAIANRNGGITKILALPERCQDFGTGDFETSSGKDDILPWADEDCRAWHTEFPEGSRQRPVAWTRGKNDEEACEITDQKVWTTVSQQAPDSLAVVRLNGDDGSIEETIPVPDVHATGWGAYGGAVDADGNFFISFYGGSKDVVRIDHETLEYEIFESPLGVDYGITVDEEGRVWVCGDGVARLDPATGIWAYDNHDALPLHTGPVYSGCQSDGAGKLWVGMMVGMPDTLQPLRGVDTETLEIVDEIGFQEHIHGVSIDADGFIWGVSAYGQNAYKVDPETYDWEVYDGLIGAYTYSDMTGLALANAGAAG